MGNTKSIAAGKSGGTAKADQASAHAKGAVARRRINVQNVLLIWLDNNIDENSTDCRNTIIKLRHIVNDINTFIDGDECIQFLEAMDNQKACLIISGSLGQNIMPRIHNMSQVDSIFIFCGNKNRHEQWTKEWSKIKGVFTEIAPICEALKQAAQQCEQNAIPMSFVATNGDTSNKSLDQLNPSFMYTQILKEILLTIEFQQEHIKQFIAHCREQFLENVHQLNNIKKFERQYGEETPIWWYTSQGFLYPMLNRTLRLMDIDLIIKMGFFIVDLHRHIEQLHSEQFGGDNSGNSFMVYRGQGMTKEDFEKMKKTKDGLISFNNFLSTSKNHDVSLLFAESNQSNPDLVGIFFVMTIDPSKSTTPFASITDISYFKDEDEILFSMHTVFRINDVTPMGKNDGLFRVELTLTSDSDQDLRRLTDRIRVETRPDVGGWYRLGVVLLKMGQSEKAQQVYEVMLEQTTDMSETGRIYHQLGWAKYSQGQYEKAITFLEKALEIKKKTLAPNDPGLGNCYHDIGVMYDNMGEYSKALSFYDKDLEISQKSLSPNHPDLAKSYITHGIAYSHMEEYSKAITFYEKGLEIQQQSLPPNHPDLAASYNNIGLVYDNMCEYSKALSSFEKALEIQQKSLLSNHPDLAGPYNNIGLVYYNMHKYSKAVSYYEKALEIRQQTLPSNHPDLVASYNNIGALYDNMREYTKALSSYEKALEIQQQLLLPNHPNLAASYNNVGEMYYEMGEYSKALSSHEKALEIQQQSLPPNHPSLASSHNKIGLVYVNMGEYSKALSSYEKALEVQQQSLPPNHPDLATSYSNIALMYKIMGEYLKALSSHEKVLEIRKQSLSPNHPSLASSYNNIASVYDNMGEYSKAISSYQRAVEIGQQSLPSNHPDLEMYRTNLDIVKKKL